MSHSLLCIEWIKSGAHIGKKGVSAEKERECAFSVDFHKAASITLNEFDEEVECWCLECM